MKENNSFKVRTWDFINSSFGLWFLSTCVVGLITFLYTQHQENQRAQDEQKQDEVEQARHNASLVTVLLPHLASDDEKEWKLAIEVTKYLKLKGELPGELESALMGIIQVSDSNKSPTEQAKANAAAAIIDLQSDSIQKNNPVKTISLLPARVYIQIANDDQKGVAKILQTTLQKQSFLVPGIENVGKKPGIGIPNKTEVRYYRDEEKPEALKLIEVLKGLDANLNINETPRKIPGNGRNTRPRHYEIWFHKP